MDESIRGAIPPPPPGTPELFKQITLTFNPWSDKIWIKKRFFDCEPDPDILAKTTNYMCNEWLDDADFRMFERMKKNNPKRYRVAGLGDWGIIEGLIYENWEERYFTNEFIRNKKGKWIYGLDFGYSNDPTAVFIGFIDLDNKELYVVDEIYKKNLSNELIYKELCRKELYDCKIVADSAEPKSIDRLRELGIRGIKGARKGKDSINNGIDFIQDFRIFIHPRCVNFLTEISTYVWDTDKDGKILNKPVDDYNHLMDAMRYAVADVAKGDSFSFD